MNFFSQLLFLFSIIYLTMGVVMLFKDRKAALNRTYFVLNLSLFIWSFATAVSIIMPDKASCIIWNTIASIGFCTFSSLALHFLLVYTKKDNILKKWWIYIVLYLPAIIFIFQAIKQNLYFSDVIYNQYGWRLVANAASAWYWILMIFIGILGTINMYLCYSVLRRATSTRERKQTKIIFFSGATSFLFTMGYNVCANIIIKAEIPDMIAAGMMIWQLGILYAIIKYKLMTLSPSLIAENLFQTIIDSVILTDQKGIILSINPETQRLLGYTQKELGGEPLGRLFLSDGESTNTSISELLNSCPIRNVETFMVSSAGVNIPIILSISECSDNYNTRIGFVLASKDVTEYKIAEGKIQYLATHDSLTGLPNRLMLSQILNHSIQTAKRHKRKLAVFFIDLDRFKIINDTKGHEAGDQLLQEIAMRYKQTLRAEDVVSRQGGDEFIILIEDFNKLSDLELVANNILASTYKPIVLLGDECRVTASIGISIYPQDGEDEQLLMKHADMAMYYAKEEGKNNFQFYSEDIQLQSAGRLAIETNLRLALERNELSLHYQAKVNFKTGIITGVEALLRWQNPHLGSVTPTQFIPVAEETGMIVSIGKWVLKTACAQNVAWQKQGLPAVCMAVNLSLRQLADNNLIDDIKAALNDSGMAPNLLELEITESMIMTNPTKMMDVLVRIKSIGVRLAIDDFGTGYSSLAQLKHFPIDTLKIDRSFIRNVPENAEDKAITHAIIAMGETLGLTVVAEGVETIEQMNYLKDQSCDEMQGFHFSRPIVPEQFADLLREQADTSLT